MVGTVDAWELDDVAEACNDFLNKWVLRNSWRSTLAMKTVC